MSSIGRRQHPLQSRRPHGWISNRLDAAGQVRWTNDCNCRKLTFHSPSGRVTGIRQDQGDALYRSDLKRTCAAGSCKPASSLSRILPLVQV